MDEPVPQSVLEYVAAQLHTSPAAFSQYGKRDATRREHAAKIQKLFRYRQWNRAAEQELTPLLLELALQTENGMRLRQHSLEASEDADADAMRLLRRELIERLG